MGSHGCVDVNSSSTMLMTGLYVAGASLACMAAMLYDIVVAGVLARKPWLPCKYFKLQSITLTLLGAATKLSADLNTSMPGPWDQLSKLTGIAIICIAMGFLAPSVGVTTESESFTNMVALSIFVATLAANICIQLYTGVITLFFVEYILMLCLMLILLLMLWHIYFYIKTEKRIDGDGCIRLLSTGNPSLFERLKACFGYAYCSNPQFKISTLPVNAAISPICLACLGIIMEAAFRSLFLKQLEFCQGVSDYGWSTKIIVITQFATGVVGTIAVVVRWVAMFNRMDLDIIFEPFCRSDDDVIQMNKTMTGNGISWYRNCFGSLIRRIILIPQVLIVVPSFLMCCLFYPPLNDWVEGFGADHDTTASGLMVGKGVDEMIRLKDQVANSKSQNYTWRFLSLKSSYRDFKDMKIQDGNHCIEVGCFSMALLVKIAEASIPKHLLESILNVFQEAEEVIYFIDKTLKPKSSVNIDKLAYARAVWKEGGFTCLLPGDLRPALDHVVAVEIIKKLRAVMGEEEFVGSDSNMQWLNKNFSLQREVALQVNFILGQSYSSIEGLCEHIERLFVDMLHTIYAHLPEAIFESLRSTPVQEFEKSARVALKFLFEIGSLECQKNWLFPAGMTSMTQVVDEEVANLRSYLPQNMTRLTEVLLDPDHSRS